MSEFAHENIRHPLKRRPNGVRQHVSAGPYSPVLEVDARMWAVKARG